MDSKPPIDLERLKTIKDERKKKEEPLAEIEEPFQWVLMKDGWVKRKPDPSLTDPYYQRRHIVNISDFDEWV